MSDVACRRLVCALLHAVWLVASIVLFVWVPFASFRVSLIVLWACWVMVNAGAWIASSSRFADPVGHTGDKP